MPRIESVQVLYSIGTKVVAPWLIGVLVLSACAVPPLSDSAASGPQIALTFDDAHEAGERPASLISPTEDEDYLKRRFDAEVLGVTEH